MKGVDLLANFSNDADNIISSDEYPKFVASETHSNPGLT